MRTRFSGCGCAALEDAVAGFAPVGYCEDDDDDWVPFICLVTIKLAVLCLGGQTKLLLLSDQLEALRVEAVALPAGDGLQQRLLLLRAAGRLQLVHGGQVEEDALVQVLRRVLLHQALQLAQRLLQAAQVEQAHRRVVVGLRTHGGRGGFNCARTGVTV